MHQNRYRIYYRQNGKEYKYFIAAKNAEVAEQILMIFTRILILVMFAGMVLSIAHTVGWILKK